MSIKNGLFTSESVSAGHPDKLCDCISDSILDSFLRLDPQARVACETFAIENRIIVAGEFRTSDESGFRAVEENAAAIVRGTLKEIGYGSHELDIDPDTCEIDIRFNQQSPQIAAGVDREDGALGAGDQGLVFGYACNETTHLTPLAWTLATALIAEGTRLLRNGGTFLRPDAKSQVTVRYENGIPVGIETVVLSWQHAPEIDVQKVRRFLEAQVIDKVIPAGQRTTAFRTLINPAGAWSIGGPKGDTGLTGRKIIVDTYGGSCPHGGGAFSGKDPSKVDRSGAYAARWVAKHVVAAGLAKRCSLQVSYAIGHPEPVSVYVDQHDTGIVVDRVIAKAISDVFDLSPGGIIRDLDLLRPVYASTSSLGHFGAWRDPELHTWERTDRIDALRASISTHVRDWR